MAETINNEQNMTPISRRPINMPPMEVNAASAALPNTVRAKAAMSPQPDPLAGVDLDTPLPMPDDDVDGMEMEPGEYQEIPQAQAPLDLFATQEAIDEASAEGYSDEQYMDESQEVSSKTPEVQPNVTVINVPKDKADDFVQTMPLETYNKMVKSDTIQINEVELKDVPTATRRIDSVEEYRAIRSRRKNQKAVELTERVLVNSGFIVVLKPATSMELSTIYKDYMSDSSIDYAKAYQFCFEHTVDTSIGQLSYNEYVSMVSPTDIETILDGIYEISESPKRKIEVLCGLGDNGCGRTYTIDVDVSTLPNMDSIPKETAARAKEIIEVRHDIAKARELQAKSPVSNVKIVKFDDRYIYLRTASGHMMIERNDRMPQIMEKYGQLVGILAYYIDKISVQVQEREDAEPVTYDLTDVDVICDELTTLSDEDLSQIKTLINNDIKDYEPVRYSLKGTFECPHCHNKKTNIPCNISDLIFQKVQRMLI